MMRNSLFPELVAVSLKRHNETFNLPKRATLLSQDDAMKNQAFTPGCTVGVQFHHEVTFPQISYGAKGFTRSENGQMLLETEQHIRERVRCCRSLIDAFNG